MEHVKIVLYGVLSGFRDSILGIQVLYKLDQAKPKKDAEQKTKRTTLSMRREAEGLSTKRTKDEEPRVFNRIVECCILNGGVFLASILFFNYVLLPCVHWILTRLHDGTTSNQGIWWWLQPLLSYTFGTLWVMPLFMLSRVVNCIWFQDIADQTYRHLSGRPRPMTSASRYVADAVFSILVQLLFLIQSVFIGCLPIPAVRELLYYLHLCLLYSLYSFEYKWFNMGWELHKRLTYIEENWPYFVGFGFPLVVLTSLSSSFMVNGCVFSMLFPWFIVSGHEAVPVIGTAPRRLQLFSPSVCVSNVIFDQIIRSKAGPNYGKKSSAKPSPAKPSRGTGATSNVTPVNVTPARRSPKAEPPSTTSNPVYAEVPHFNHQARSFS